MPHLLVFVPCQKVIVNRDDQSLSLIGLIHGLTIPLSSKDLSDAIAANASAPVSWSVVSVWLQQTGEENKAFEQRVDISFRKGGRVHGTPQLFKMSNRIHQVYLNVVGFPIRAQGECKLKLFVRELKARGPEPQWRKVREYPIEIKYSESQEPVNEQAPLKTE